MSTIVSSATIALSYRSLNTLHFTISFSIIINIKAATGALTFYSSPKGFLERRLQSGEMHMKVNEAPDLSLMAKELGALILNMRQ